MAPVIRILIALIASASTLAMNACDNAGGTSTAGASRPIPGNPPKELITIKGEDFQLELANTDALRVQGLSDRTEIDDDGGMIFIFKDADKRDFVMRRCFVPIDIAFLDPQGRVTAVHAMTVEPPQREGESDVDYQVRLEKYGSRFDAQFALEFKGGTIERIGLKRGDTVNLDLVRLKSLAE
ncbi:MAG: DUF192 domain-containing protein [Planctomycetota bacterium]